MNTGNFITALILLFKEKMRPFLHPDLDRKNKLIAIERQKLYESFLVPGGLAFDVGANLGNRVETFLLMKVKVVAFEPQTTCYQFLKLKYANRISLLKIALGESVNKGTINLNKDSTTIATMSTQWKDEVAKGRFSRYRWGKTQAVEINTLENQIKKFGRPDFVKIDVEGFEEQVLKGLKTPVPALSFEYTTPEMTRSALNCIEMIAKLSPGYEFNFAVGESTWFEKEKWLDLQTMRNLLGNNINELKGSGDIYARLKK